MMKRSLLRRQLSNAWRTTMDEQYRQRLINSERGLQVYICAALLKAFDDDGAARRIFVEPRLVSSAGGEPRYPDVVICNTERIIGVVELKYLPRSRPKWGKDIKTLQFVGSNPRGLVIANERFRGIEARELSYPVARDAVLCWGAVYTGNRLDLRAEMKPSLRDRFLQLDAITSDGENPMVNVE